MAVTPWACGTVEEVSITRTHATAWAISAGLLPRGSDSAKQVFASAVGQRCEATLFLEGHWRSADPLSLKIDSHLDAVGDLDEGNAFIHPVILTVKGHGPLNLTRT
jgi:hypothetical protein